MLKPKPGHDPEWQAKHREYVTNNEWWIVDQILPGGTCHIVSGPSGAGKTTWLMKQLYEWDHGRPVLGYPSTRVPWVYVSCDRSSADTYRTLKRIGLGTDVWNPPIYAIEDICNVMHGFDMSTVLNAFPDAHLFVVEGLQVLLPSGERGSQNKAEMMFFIQLRAQLFAQNKAMILVTHPPKQRQVGGVQNRTDSLGSVSSGASTGTIITIDYPPVNEESPDEVSDIRTVHVSPKDIKAFKRTYRLDERGAFVDLVGDAANMKNIIEFKQDTAVTQGRMDAWLLGTVRSDHEMPTSEIYDAAKQQGVSVATCKRWIASCVSRGMLIKITHGMYRKQLGPVDVTSIQ